MYSAIAFWFPPPNPHHIPCIKNICSHFCTLYWYTSPMSSISLSFSISHLFEIHYIFAGFCCQSFYLLVFTQLSYHDFYVCFIFLYIACLRYLDAKTMWYLQFHLICANLSVSNVISWFLLCWLAVIGKPFSMIYKEQYFFMYSLRFWTRQLSWWFLYTSKKINCCKAVDFLKQWCRWPESNRHGIATGGFWVRYVCQFHHSGKLFTKLL